MQYRVSFLIELGSFTLWTTLEFAVVVVLLGRFSTMQGWQLPDVALLYGFSSMAFGLAEMAGRGFDAPFERMMRAGAFDGVLVRPLSTVFQVLASEFQLRRLGRVAQGAAAFIYACSARAIEWTPAHVLLVPLTIASGTLIYVALMALGATICFWTIKTPEVINVVTVGGNQVSSYPLSIFSAPIRAIFLFVIPVGFTSYPAGLLLLGRTDPNGLPAWAAWAAPLIALCFSALALGCWRFGVAHYTSSGT